MKDARSEKAKREEVRLLLLGVWREERQALERAWNEPPRLRVLPHATFADALPALEARGVDLLVCDLDVFLFLREAADTGPANGVASPLEAGALAALVLVSPGEEARAAALLEQERAEFVLRAGNYLRLLPAFARRALHRREIYWDEVAAIIRHEINNPLTGVLGNAELILAEVAGLPEKVRRRLATIIQLAVRLRDVVRNLEARLTRQPPRRTNTPLVEREPALPLPREVVR